MVRRTAGGAATVPSVTIVSSIAYLGVVILSINCRKSQQRKEGYCNLLNDMHCLLFAARQLSALANKRESGARANARSAMKFFGLNLLMNGSGLRFIHSALPC